MGTFTETDGTVKKLKNGSIYISEKERELAKEEKTRAKAESKEDEKIAKAQNVCRKVGFTPGTDKFADCTIKMMSQGQGQGQGQGQTVIVGQRKSGNIYPLHCRQMGGASDC